jgi:hypothetical protein
MRSAVIAIVFASLAAYAADAADPGWRELVPRLIPAGLLPDDEELVSRILAG